MELTMQDLKVLIGSDADKGQMSIYDHLIGKHVLIRTRISGVSVGTLAQVETSDAGWAVKLDDGIRVHSWEGALACSTLAVEGPSEVKTERHPAGVVITDSGMEIHAVSDAAWGKFDG